MDGTNQQRTETLDDRPKKRKRSLLLALGAIAVLGTGGVVGLNSISQPAPTPEEQIVQIVKNTQPTPAPEEQTVQVVKNTQPVLEPEGVIMVKNTQPGFRNFVPPPTPIPTLAPTLEPTPVVEQNLVLEGYEVRQLTSLPGLEAGPAVSEGGTVLFYHALTKPMAEYAVAKMLGGFFYRADVPKYTIAAVPVDGGTVKGLYVAQIPGSDEIADMVISALMSGEEVSLEALVDRMPASPAFSSDGDELFFIAGEIPIVQKGEKVFPLYSESKGPVTEARWSPGGSKLALIADGNAYTYNISTESLSDLGQADGLSWRGSTLILSRNGSLVSIAYGYTRDLGIEGVEPRVSPDRGHMAYFVPRTIEHEGEEFTVYDLNLTDFRESEEIITRLAMPSLEWSPDGEMFAVSTVNSIILHTDEGRYLGKLEPPEGKYFNRFTWSSDGNALITEVSSVNEEALAKLMAETSNLGFGSLGRIGEILDPVNDAFEQDLYVYELDVSMP